MQTDEEPGHAPGFFYDGFLPEVAIDGRMRFMLRRMTFLALGVLLVSASARGENAANDTEAAEATASLQQNIARCLSAPPGKANVRIAFVLKADGTVDGAPRILDGAQDPQGKTFALAAIRAILRCMPYQGGPTGAVVATFSQTDD